MPENLSIWIHVALRWFHVLAGISWIGQTYLFNAMERWMREDFERGDSVADADPNLVGRTWMVHGGGFYVVNKRAYTAPLPKRLHWFRWEAALTWLSGVLLLVQVYYLGGALLDPHLSPFGVGLTSLIVLGVFAVAWFVYDAMVLSPLGRHELALAGICYGLILAVAYGFSQLLSGRAMFMHIGAMFGTIMVTNVWVRILPTQGRLLAAAAAGKKPEGALEPRGPVRSKHNTYMSVPLILIMISNHFPVVLYGAAHPLLTLAGMIAVGWVGAKIIRDVL